MRLYRRPGARGAARRAPWLWHHGRQRVARRRPRYRDRLGPEAAAVGLNSANEIGIAITNLSDIFRFKIHPHTIDKFGDVSLNIFLGMSPMSMQLWVLAEAAVTIMLVMMVQMLTITLFAVVIVFRAMGRDYDACVITTGFVGLGLGATPVAIANMDAIT